MSRAVPSPGNISINININMGLLGELPLCPPERVVSVYDSYEVQGIWGNCSMGTNVHLRRVTYVHVVDQ